MTRFLTIELTHSKTNMLAQILLNKKIHQTSKLMTDNQTLTPTPGPAYRHLDVFVGTWHTTGNMKTGVETNDILITGTDTYEWLPGGFFLLHKVNVLMGTERKESLEIIGFDASTNTYPMHFFDNQGESGMMHASEHHGIWTFASDNLRFTGAFSEDSNTISGIWEQNVDDNWELLMDIKLVRAR